MINIRSVSRQVEVTLHIPYIRNGWDLIGKNGVKISAVQIRGGLV